MRKTKAYTQLFQGSFSLLMLMLTLLPSGIFFLKHKRDMQRWALVNEEVLQLKMDAHRKNFIQKNNAKFLANRTPETIETFCQRLAEETSLLGKERAILKTLIYDEAHIASEEEFDYYHFLSTQNKLLLFQEPMMTDSVTTLSLRAPVQCNETDIATLLTRLDCSSNKHSCEPIFLKNWEMHKKKSPLGNEFWLIQMSMIKREVVDVS